MRKDKSDNVMPRVLYLSASLQNPGATIQNLAADSMLRLDKRPFRTQDAACLDGFGGANDGGLSYVPVCGGAFDVGGFGVGAAKVMMMPSPAVAPVASAQLLYFPGQARSSVVHLGLSHKVPLIKAVSQTPKPKHLFLVWKFDARTLH